MRYGKWILAFVVALAGCHAPVTNNLPPAEQLMHPGPGVDGPGPGVMMYQPPPCAPMQTVQVQFLTQPGMEGMQVFWDVTAPGAFDSEGLYVPGRYNFAEGQIYRLKLTQIPGQPGVELFPTLELGPTVPRSQAFLAHNAIPTQFTREDFDQVLSGNFVTKVIYLPDPEFQELALAGVETLVSTRLDPGVDPVIEADRRGAILAIVRLGNKDLRQAVVPAVGGMMPGGVVPTGAVIGANGLPCPAPGAMMGLPGAPGAPVAMAQLPGGYVSGVTGPNYGMPISGTPIGLPGPPHIPLGIPAGLQSHTMVNHTHNNLPNPTDHMRIDVKQRPGMSYPNPVNHVRIVEDARPGGRAAYTQPAGYRRQGQMGEGGAPCPADAGTAPCPTDAGAAYPAGGAYPAGAEMPAAQ